MNFPSSHLTEGIKMFFTVSLAISFPLMIFPCRTSIHSLLYRRVHIGAHSSNAPESNPSSYDLVGNYMPEARFKGITLGILLTSLVVGILIPNIELVLGLLGSTMGMLIALILPSLLFIKVNSKASAERLLAQGIMLMGLVLIVTGTYLNMAHMNEVQNISEVGPTESLEKLNLDLQIPQTGDIAKSAVGASQSADNSATRKEPVAPEPPPEETEKKDILSEQKLEQTDEKGKQKGEDKPAENKAQKNSQGLDAKDDSLRKTLEVKDDKSLGDTLHPDAIKKEEKENKEEGDNDKKTQVDQIEKKQAELLEKIEEQQQEQKKILAEQKEILKELKDHKNKQEEDAKRKDLELQGNSAANPHLNNVPSNLQGHADPAILIQNPGEPVVSHDLKSSLLKDNPEALHAFDNLQPKNAYQINPQVPNQPAELNAYHNSQINSGIQIPRVDTGAVGGRPQESEMGRSTIQKGKQVAQGDNQPKLANKKLPNTSNQGHIMNVAGYAGGQAAYIGGQEDFRGKQEVPFGNQAAYLGGEVDFGGNQEVPFGNQAPSVNNKLPVLQTSIGNEAVRLEHQGPPPNNINEGPISSAQKLNEQVADIKTGPAGIPGKDIQMLGQREDPATGNMQADPIQSEKKDSTLIGVGKKSLDINAQKAAAAHLDSDLNSNMLKEQQSKQVRPPMKVPVIKSYIQKETQKQGHELTFSIEKLESEKVIVPSSQDKEKDKVILKKMKVTEEDKREKKNNAHDEERRKRHVEAPYSPDFPELDLLKEVVRKDIGDVAYDTRHLLWTHRRRKKKRPNKNRDYQYWDET
ncbi:putative sodium-coupled neutral amino acid transporter 10 isoform X2 [Penaeus chinensis]|uniref:putative sodium-coupled neutral amino acid transporter 10 isoform X2 n=1 Tax=Penaeus chinensis TaxID=139456 RepID=UPI001FB7C241|nr:putative sodium-coupled neutral amino acid transporter 10 isoform X2 [Penaeus chinensis]